ncbi:MAG: hypothetical protein NWE98_12280 [Candidatus Bathyarchaeota archaeon]|nr:hypothetical protein [Candidatus Bathyarchaeota archaeon]
MSVNLDGLIEQKESQLLPYLKRMEQLKTRFITQTAAFASEWYKKTAKEYFAKYLNVTLKLKEEQISQMKMEVNELIDDAEKNVKQELDNPEPWWHLKPHIHESIDQYLQVADKYPIVIDRPVRRVLGRLGLILEKHGYNITVQGKRGSYPEFWFENAQETAEVMPYYPHLLKWSEDMTETIREYHNQYLKASALFMEIQDLKQEKKRQEALNRWNSL